MNLKGLCFLAVLAVILDIVLSKNETVNKVKCGETKTESGKFCNKNSAKSVALWWKEMSTLEPVKCNLPSGWSNTNSEHSKLFENSFPVKSFPCEENERTTDYFFEGKIKDFNFEGFGHLELDTNSRMTSGGSCLQVNTINGFAPVKVIGNFSNGLLNGSANIYLENGIVILADFKAGLFHGLRRDWDSNGELSFLGFYERGSRVGKCWAKVGKNLIYQDCSTTDRSDEKAILIPMDATKPVLAGEYFSNIFSFDQIQQAKLMKAYLEDNSCMMKVDVEIGKGLDFYFDIFHDQAIPKSALQEKPLCQLGQFKGQCLEALFVHNFILVENFKKSNFYSQSNFPCSCFDD
jgi:hypothetical protein